MKGNRAGLPILSTLKDLVETGDEIVKIEGIFSGTLSYIFNNFSSMDSSSAPQPFSEIVAGAKANGYTVGHMRVFLDAPHQFSFTSSGAGPA